MESSGITRCEMLKDVGLVGIGALLGSGLTTLAGARRERGIAQGAGSERLWYLSHTGQGMADIGECFDTASRIDAAYESS